MKVKCKLSNVDSEKLRLYNIETNLDELHVTDNKIYLVLGLTFTVKNNNLVCFVEHVSDHGNVIASPLIFFSFMDKKVSKLWEIKEFENGDIAIWPTVFFERYFHDDLSEGVPEISEKFNKILKIMENE